MRRRALAPHLSRRAAVVAALVGLFLASGFSPVHPAMPVAAGTAESMEAKFLALINADRTARGLTTYVLHVALIDLAGDRAATMASKNQLSHDAAGCLGCQLDARHIQRYSSGEVIGATGYPWGDAAVTSLYNAWKGSSSHWGLLMSKTYNYIGIGVAYRSSTATTFASIVMTESVDQTRPWAQMASATRSGTGVSWTWRGNDHRLQSHTAGLKNFDVQYRVDNGSWITLRYQSTSTSLSLSSRNRGHYYGLRVRSRDNRNYVSNWTPELRVWVP